MTAFVAAFRERPRFFSGEAGARGGISQHGYHSGGRDRHGCRARRSRRLLGSDGGATLTAWDLARAAERFPTRSCAASVRGCPGSTPGPGHDHPLLQGDRPRGPRSFEDFGRFFTMLARMVIWAPRPPYDVRDLLRQMARVGVNSVPVVFLTTLFTGMVLALERLCGLFPALTSLRIARAP